MKNFTRHLREASWGEIFAWLALIAVLLFGGVNNIGALIAFVAFTGSIIYDAVYWVRSYRQTKAA